MWKVLLRARRSFARDENGNFGILFGFAAIPIIGLLGGAVDVTRHNRYEMTLLNAMDSAAIALVRRGAKNDAEADDFVNNYIDGVAAWHKADDMLHLARFDATEIEGGWRVEAKGDMDTAFLPVVGLRKMPLDLVAEVQMSGGKYEIALALDNTGSMASHRRMQVLRESAAQLVDDLYREEGTLDRVKMALVPFVTAVNIKADHGFNMDWINPVGASDVYHLNFSEPVNRLELFEQMGPRVNWRGCVEAREGHDEEDTPPIDAATRFVPYLWPDEPDDSGFNNSYLEDSVSGSDHNRLRDIEKYRVPRGTRVSDTTSLGPNAACPRALVPLTNDIDTMKREIRLMKPHNETGGNSSGTNVAQGLLWAWRVLSDEAPFSEGVPYEDEETTKVLVLLSDGRNQIVANNEVTESDYNSYSYLADGRLGSEDNYLVAERAVDEKVKRICGSIKGKNIRLYTILFEVDFERTQELFRNCASKDEDGKPLYYYVPDASALESAFRKIGEDLTTLHVSR